MIPMRTESTTWPTTNEMAAAAINTQMSALENCARKIRSGLRPWSPVISFGPTAARRSSAVAVSSPSAVVSSSS